MNEIIEISKIAVFKSKKIRRGLSKRMVVFGGGCVLGFN